MGILTKIFGSKSDREIKKILPTVKEVNQFYDSLEDTDITFLKNRTKELQKIILCDVQNIIYPNIERAFLNLIHDSGYEGIKFEKKVNFEQLYNERFN